MIGIFSAQWNVVQPHSMRRMLSFLGTAVSEPRIGVSFASAKTLIRIPLGVCIIVAFRAYTKPLLFRALPPIFRVMEHLDLDLPRRYFLKASEYRTVPRLQQDDTVLPSRSDMGKMLTDIRRRRGRAVSVGPQSIADAYEVIAYNEEAKRRSRSNSVAGKDAEWRAHGRTRSHSDSPAAVPGATTMATASALRQRHAPPPRGMGAAPAARTGIVGGGIVGGGRESSDEEGDAQDRRAILSSIPRSRIRYDVEVITKLIVYAGIAWWAVEGCLGVFELVGLGR
jgi:hypothetical protein